MKILYVPGRWDPTLQNEFSGSDFGAYQMLKKQPGAQVSLVKPLVDEPNLLERILSKAYEVFSQKRLIKYYPSSLKRAGVIVNQAIRDAAPDVIFSKYSAPMVHAKIDRPFVYMCDSTIKWTKAVWPHFSEIGFWIMEKWEEKSIRECDRLITFSEANAEVIKTYYQKPPDQVRVLPIPAFIPSDELPLKDGLTKGFGETLHLLTVGKRFHLRGIDIAIETAQLLNALGCPTELRIVGLDGKDQPNVKFLGMYNKEQPDELAAYFGCFKWADLLIHPSRFHSAGIVISEAAAFGLPTITNAAGGLSTTVQHDLTGVVLPEASPASAYADAILALRKDMNRYYQYRLAARARFDQELNWEKAGQVLFEILQEVSL